MSSVRRQLVATILGGVLLASMPALAVALDGGAQNGIDSPTSGVDDPDTPDMKGTYSVDNYVHDFYLSEWLEPADDWVRNKWLWWTAAAETKLNNENADKSMAFEVRIKNQDYYDYNNGALGVKWATNLPFSKAAENENPLEEWIYGYTEIDIELRDPIQINREVFYFWDLRIDAERVPTSTQPVFNAEIEYCPKGFPLNGECFYDQLGEFRKVVLQR